jgi:hypothetical protein
MSYIKVPRRSHGQIPQQQKTRQMKIYAAHLLDDTTMAESIIEAIKVDPAEK